MKEDLIGLFKDMTTSILLIDGKKEIIKSIKIEVEAEIKKIKEVEHQNVIKNIKKSNKPRDRGENREGVEVEVEVMMLERNVA